MCVRVCVCVCVCVCVFWVWGVFSEGGPQAADSGFEGTRPDKPLDDAAAEMFLQKLYDETGSLESLHALR